MSDQKRRAERHAPLQHVIRILGDITADWDVGQIAPDTRLGDLGLESINLVYLIAEIQQYYGLQDLLFRRLVAAGIPINDLSVADVVGFIDEIRATSLLEEETRQ